MKPCRPSGNAAYVVSDPAHPCAVSSLQGVGHRSRCNRVAAFTVTELLVVLAVLGLLAVVQVPVLCRTKSPTQLAQCMSNCRQLALATTLYRNDNGDNYPFGNRVYGTGAGSGSVIDPTGWPMQLLPYMGGYKGVQPSVFLCPSEQGTNAGWAFQLHYQANRMMLSDNYDRNTPVSAAQVRNPAIYWLFMEKGPSDFANARPGTLAIFLQSWNVAPGCPQYRRHSGGLSVAAADGHTDWLCMPPYQPGRIAPSGFPELGDCANGLDPASTWQAAGPYIKLYSRYSQTGF